MKFSSALQWFDLRSAILGALLMSCLVAGINSGHGMLPAFTAALKQATYTFFVAGFIVQLCRWLAARELPGWVAVSNATLSPTLLTVVMVYSMHNFKGTPEPFWSTLPVVIISLVTFLLVSRSVVAQKNT